jgi:hypothetical protein
LGAQEKHVAEPELTDVVIGRDLALQSLELVTLAREIPIEVFLAQPGKKEEGCANAVKPGEILPGKTLDRHWHVRLLALPRGRNPCHTHRDRDGSAGERKPPVHWYSMVGVWRKRW